MNKKKNRLGPGVRLSIILLAVVGIASLLAPLLAPYGPNEMGPAINQAPSADHLFGTDSMGRDLLSRILYGGRASLCIGLMAAAISTGIAMVYGSLSGMSRRWVDRGLMGFADLMLSVPQILIVVFLQAIFGKSGYLSLALSIGVTGWMAMARIIRNEVRRIRETDYVTAARMMGGSFGYILRKHLLPGFLPAVLYAAVSSIGAAMMTEATLSFMGLGLPVAEVSWGSLLSDSRNALLSDSWWIILIPGIVLIGTLIAIAALGEQVRKGNTRLHSNL